MSVGKQELEEFVVTNIYTWELTESSNTISFW